MTTPIKLDQLVFPRASLQVTKLLMYLSSDDPDLDEIDKTIMQDPVLAGTLLRYANSPLYRRGGEVSNVPTATRLIGLKNVRSAVVMSTLRATCPVDNELSHTILEHSLSVATLCKLIARQTCPGVQDDLELVGLIHDIGMVVLSTNVEVEYKALIAQSQAEQVALDVLEQASFGFNHDQIAVKALHEFRLPKRHETVLLHFHQQNEELDEAMAKERAVLVLAHRLLDEQGENPHFIETLFESTDSLCEQLDIDNDTLTALREQARNTLAAAAN